MKFSFGKNLWGDEPKRSVRLGVTPTSPRRCVKPSCRCLLPVQKAGSLAVRTPRMMPVLFREGSLWLRGGSGERTPALSGNCPLGTGVRQGVSLLPAFAGDPIG